MAEGYLKHIASEYSTPISAGIEPKGLNPLAVEAMSEIGVDISQQTSKAVASFLGTHVPYVVTVCDDAAERCPIFPGTWKFLHWSFDDPAAAEGTHDEKLKVFRRVRDELTSRIDAELLPVLGLQRVAE